MRARIAVAALCAALAACGSAAEDEPGASVMAARPVSAAVSATPVPSSTAASLTVAAQGIADWDATGCGDDLPARGSTVRHPRLMRRSPEELRSVFGKPSNTSEFRMGEAVGTFASGLGSLLPGGEKANARRMAREETWTKSGCNLSVFFADMDGRWSAIDAVEWTVGSEF